MWKVHLGQSDIRKIGYIWTNYESSPEVYKLLTASTRA